MCWLKMEGFGDFGHLGLKEEIQKLSSTAESKAVRKKRLHFYVPKSVKYTFQ